MREGATEPKAPEEDVHNSLLGTHVPPSMTHPTAAGACELYGQYVLHWYGLPSSSGGSQGNEEELFCRPHQNADWLYSVEASAYVPSAHVK